MGGDWNSKHSLVSFRKSIHQTFRLSFRIRFSLDDEKNRLRSKISSRKKPFSLSAFAVRNGCSPGDDTPWGTVVIVSIPERRGDFRCGNQTTYRLPSTFLREFPLYAAKKHPPEWRFIPRQNGYAASLPGLPHRINRADSRNRAVAAFRGSCGNHITTHGTESESADVFHIHK